MKSIHLSNFPFRNNKNPISFININKTLKQPESYIECNWKWYFNASKVLHIYQ